MSSVFGDRIKMTIFGESHGLAIGLVIDGLPAGLELDLASINLEMARRAPGLSELSTARKKKTHILLKVACLVVKLPACLFVLLFRMKINTPKITAF